MTRLSADFFFYFEYTKRLNGLSADNLHSFSRDGMSLLLQFSDRTLDCVVWNWYCVSQKVLMYGLQVDTKLQVKIKSTWDSILQALCKDKLKSLTSYLLISEIVTRFFFNSRIDHKRVVGVPVNKRLANSLREGWYPRYSTELSKEIFVLA